MLYNVVLFETRFMPRNTKIIANQQFSAIKLNAFLLLQIHLGTGRQNQIASVLQKIFTKSS